MFKIRNILTRFSSVFLLRPILTLRYLFWYRKPKKWICGFLVLTRNDCRLFRIYHVCLFAPAFMMHVAVFDKRQTGKSLFQQCVSLWLGLWPVCILKLLTVRSSCTNRGQCHINQLSMNAQAGHTAGLLHAN